MDFGSLNTRWCAKGQGEGRPQDHPNDQFERNIANKHAEPCLGLEHCKARRAVGSCEVYVRCRKDGRYHTLCIGLRRDVSFKHPYLQPTFKHYPWPSRLQIGDTMALHGWLGNRTWLACGVTGVLCSSECPPLPPAHSRRMAVAQAPVGQRFGIAVRIGRASYHTIVLGCGCVERNPACATSAALQPVNFRIALSKLFATHSCEQLVQWASWKIT
jgi:hypothetical protein